MTYKYGIDFGTTNSSVAIALIDENHVAKPNLMLVDPASLWGPGEFVRSTFYIDIHGRIYVGSDAEQCMQAERKSGAFSANRYFTQIKMALTKQSETIVSPVQFEEQLKTLLELLKVKADAFAAKNHIAINGVVIGVPVSYTEEKKNIYLRALVKAGYYRSMDDAVSGTEFVSEPVAVAVFYGENLTENKRVMVFDYGGGTLDIAVIDLREQIGKNDKLHPHEVIGQSTGYNIGGECLNKEFFVNYFVKRYGLDKVQRFLGIQDRCATPEELWQKMQCTTMGMDFMRAVEGCKIALSRSDSVEFIPPETTVRLADLRPITVNRSDFEGAVSNVFSQVNKVISECLDECKTHLDKNGKPDPVYPNQISEVLLAGGSSLIPYVRELLVENSLRRESIGRNVDSKQLKSREVLGSIVGGLSIVGCKTYEIEPLVDCSYGIWDEGRKEFAEIIPCGTKLSQVAADVWNDSAGISRSFLTVGSNISTLVIKLMQKTGGVNNNYEKILKEVKISVGKYAGNEFDLYLSVDKQTKMLVLKIKVVKQNKFLTLKPDESKVEINI